MATNTLSTNPEFRQIPLTNGGYALVYSGDYEWLMTYKWFRSERGYALQTSKRVGKNSGAGMHRVILNPPKGMVTDHINGDRLDNRRSNLRIADHLQNAQNRGKNKNSRSKYKGVAWKVENNKWQARIRIGTGQHHLGLYDTEEDAAHAYNVAAILHHGNYKRLNVLPEGYTMPEKPKECPLCHSSTREPVLVSLEKCAAKLMQRWQGETIQNAIDIAETVLKEAGVKYVD